MSSHKLRRTLYRDPNAPGTPTRLSPIETQHTESVVDQELLIVPAQMVHASAVHDWGVHEGFEVRARATKPGIHVFAGVASDIDGNHISMSDGGSAELGPPYVPTPPPQPPPPPRPHPSQLAAVTTSGVKLETTGLQGAYYVTVGFWETFDDALYNQSNQSMFYMDHTPWLLLEKVTNFTDDGKRVVLAQIDFPTDGTTGAVMGLSPGIRRQGGIHAQRIKLRKPRLETQRQGVTVDDIGYGEVRPLADGISVSVPRASDQIVFSGEDGQFRRMVVRAEEIVAQSNSGAETARIDSNLGNVVAGGNGVDGDVVVRDGNDQTMVVLDADDAQVVVGGQNNAGEVVVLDGAKGATVKLEGQGGDVRFQSRLRDMTNSYPGVSHTMLKDLTDGGLTTLHRHLAGNAARPLIPPNVLFLGPIPPSPTGTRQLFRTVGFGGTFQFTAAIILTFAWYDPFARAAWVDIPATSGVSTPPITTPAAAAPVLVAGAPARLHPAIVSGTGTSVTFRLVAPGFTLAAALGIVWGES